MRNLEKQKKEMAEYEERRKPEREKDEEVIRQLRLKRAKKLRNPEKQKEEMAEYEKMRKDEREKDEEEIRLLRLRREQRKKERAEEEKRLAEQRQSEEARRKSEELTSKEDMQKSKEQLEEEKKAILAQRIQPLDINGLDLKKLKEKAKELHDHLRKLTGDKFDHEESYKRQQKDLIELAERARQMTKGNSKKTGSDIQRVDDSFDSLADKYAGCPPKIMLHSKYERLTDHRSYDERKDLYAKIMAELEQRQESDRKIREYMKEVRGQTSQKDEEGVPAEVAHVEEPAEETGGEEVVVEA